MGLVGSIVLALIIFHLIPLAVYLLFFCLVAVIRITIFVVKPIAAFLAALIT